MEGGRRYFAPVSLQPLLIKSCSAGPTTGEAAIEPLMKSSTGEAIPPLAVVYTDSLVSVASIITVMTGDQSPEGLRQATPSKACFLPGIVSL